MLLQHGVEAQQIAAKPVRQLRQIDRQRDFDECVVNNHHLSKGVAAATMVGVVKHCVTQALPFDDGCSNAASGG